MKRKIISILLIVYFLSVFGAVKQVQHDCKYRWKYIEPDAVATAVCFFPMANTLMALTFVFYEYGIYEVRE